MMVTEERKGRKCKPWGFLVLRGGGRVRTSQGNRERETTEVRWKLKPITKKLHRGGGRAYVCQMWLFYYLFPSLDWQLQEGKSLVSLTVIGFLTSSTVPGTYQVLGKYVVNKLKGD